MKVKKKKTLTPYRFRYARGKNAYSSLKSRFNVYSELLSLSNDCKNIGQNYFTETEYSTGRVECNDPE